VYIFEEAGRNDQQDMSAFGRLPGFDNSTSLERKISDDEAHEEEESGKRSVAPKNEDVEMVKLQQAHYVESILEAMATLTDEQDDFKDKQWLQTKTFLTEHRIPSKRLERKALLIFLDTVSLHENGCEQ